MSDRAPAGVVVIAANKDNRLPYLDHGPIKQAFPHYRICLNGFERDLTLWTVSVVNVDLPG